MITVFEAETPPPVKITAPCDFVDCTVNKQLVPMVTVCANSGVCAYVYVHILTFLEVAVLRCPGINVGSVIVFDFG